MWFLRSVTWFCWPLPISLRESPGYLSPRPRLFRVLAAREPLHKQFRAAYRWNSDFNSFLGNVFAVQEMVRTSRKAKNAISYAFSCSGTLISASLLLGTHVSVAFWYVAEIERWFFVLWRSCGVIGPLQLPPGFRKEVPNFVCNDRFCSSLSQILLCSLFLISIRVETTPRRTHRNFWLRVPCVHWASWCSLGNLVFVYW